MEAGGTEATVMVTGVIDAGVTMRLRDRPDAELLRASGEILANGVKRGNGIVVGKAEDGLVIVFNDPLSALRCAMAVLSDAQSYNLGRDELAKLWLRMAIYQGELVEKPQGVAGSAVEIAGRMLGMAPAGGACLLKSVYAAIAAEAPGKVQDLGPRRLPPLTADAEVIAFVPEAKLAEDLSVAPAPPAAAAAPAPAAAPVDPEQLPGHDLGPCSIEAVIGRGGMGVVCKGRHKRLERPVAVKVITPSVTRSAAASEMLLKEARLVARLDDPRIVQVYDVGTQGQLSFIVMQLIQGETLTDRIVRGGKMSQKEARAVMREVLLALSYAHKNGVVHRDIKPSNIMIDKSGAVKLMDFGIAGATGNEEFAPDAMMSGSFDFMAPEQAFGSTPDPRMDLYSFGATYFFVLTGAPPYTGQSPMEILLKHRDAAIPDVRQFNREVTPSAAQLIMKLMQKFPEGRPSSAEEVLKALDAPGMVLDVDTSGSPFKILPPPVEAPVGVAAEMEATRGVAAAEPEAPAPARTSGLPEPPPPVAFTPGKTAPATWGIIAGLFLIFCGSSWTVSVHADWAAAGLAAMAAAALMSLSGVMGWLDRSAGPALFAAAAYCFLMFGAKPGDPFPPAVPGFEVLIASGLGVILGGAGLFLGFLEQKPDRQLGAWLLSASGAVLLLAGTARALPDSVGWSDGLPALLGTAVSSLRASGGFARWFGLLAVYAVARFVKQSEFDENAWSRKKTSDGVIINWNK